MSTAHAIEPNSPYVDFWNAVLVPKFNAWRHVLVGGLGQHSAMVFPALKLRSGDNVLDAGCGWGETAIEIAQRVGTSGSVVGDRLLRCVSRHGARGRACRRFGQPGICRGGCADLRV